MQVLANNLLAIRHLSAGQRRQSSWKSPSQLTKFVRCWFPSWKKKWASEP